MKLLLTAFFVALLGCNELKTVDATTQVTLRIQVQDADLLQKMTHVRVSLLRKDDEAWVSASSATVPVAGITWPLDISILPGSSNAIDKPFEVIVDALAGDERLAQSRVISGYARNSLRVLEIWLFGCVGREVGFVCASDECHGETCTSCDLGGSCKPVPFADPQSLPIFDPVDASTAPPGQDGAIMQPTDGGVPTDARLPMEGGGPLGMNDAGLLGDGSADGAVVPQTCSMPCPANAECLLMGTTASCRCLAGYEDKAGVCEDIDECKVANGGCPASADCSNTFGSRTCTCKPGFEQGAGGQCADKCATAGCDAHATCAIVGTNPVCTCTPPYVGTDGKTCAFDQTCSLLGCHAQASCVVSGQTRVCQCNTGYMGSGTSCTDIDECSANSGGCDTSPVATCNNQVGATNTCTCPSGYMGNGVGANGCMDTLECATNNGGCDTSPQATCVERAGAANTCTCPSGYSGNGVGTNGCTDTLECATNNGGCDTSPQASCVEQVGAANTCTCPIGYTGDGKGTSGCTDVNECSTGNGGCDQDPSATCGNDPTGAENTACTCPIGYTGDGKGTNGCTDVNECLTNNGGCAPVANCTNDPTGADNTGCICPMNYVGSGRGPNGCLRICGDVVIGSTGDLATYRDCQEIRGFLRFLTTDGAATVTASDLPFLTTVTGNVEVTSFFSGGPAIPRMTIGKLQTIGGQLYFFGNTPVEFNAPELTSVGSLSAANANLKVFNAARLTTVNGTVSITMVGSLCTLNAPISLVRGDLTLQGLEKIRYSAFNRLRVATQTNGGSVTESFVGCCFLSSGDSTGCDSMPSASECSCN